MNEWLLALGAALWLGILTSISPCPLATNIAAISYIGHAADRPRRVFWTGLAYTAGRTATYALLGVLIVASLLSIPVLSHWLQKYMNRLLGPILILTAMVLLDLIHLNLGGGRMGRLADRIAKRGDLWGAGLLGMLFALAFCPVSAALFFGSLIPLAVKLQSGLLLPSIYGIGTALPVALFAVMLSLGVKSLNSVFERITRLDLWMRRATGGVFLAIGFYFTIRYALQLV